MSTFIDTSGWYAGVVPDDPNHRNVRSWFHANTAPVITTDYVIDEILTLLRSRGEKTKAIELGRRVFDLGTVAIHYLRPDEIHRAWEYYRDNPDRYWSFTDCTSRVVIEKFHVRQVLTFDHHFAEFGGLTLLPSRS